MWMSIQILSEVLSAINVCKRYISEKSNGEKALNSVICLQDDVYARNEKRTKLIDLFKAEPSSK